MSPDVELPAASARLLRQIADHDQGHGIQFEPMPRGRRCHPRTRAVFDRSTFLPLTGAKPVTQPAGGNAPVLITSAGVRWLYLYEPGRIPGDADLLFIEASATGTVHITVREQPRHTGPGKILTIGAGQGALAALLSAPTITLCGLRTFPHNPSAGSRHYGVSRFPDERLCGSCHRALHPDDQHRAFEHPQNADEPAF